MAAYRRLFNWYTVNDGRNIAPDGWHVPSDAEWKTLTNYLGREAIAGGKLKAVETKAYSNLTSIRSNRFDARF